jgi:hypothetical protein
MRLLLSTIFTLTLYAATNATLTGIITDNTGAAIPSAGVQATRLDSNQTFRAVTGPSGLYSFAELPPGQYKLEVTRDGFKTLLRPKVELTVAGRFTENFTLELGVRAESVTVESTAPLVERESAAVETVIDRQTVQNMPLNGRSFQSLLELTPGVTFTASTITSPGQFSVNGQRTNANYFMIDGVSANVAASASATFFPQASGTLPGLTVMGGTNGLVSIDALQEFRVQTSTYAPEYGRTPGGQVTVQTRSGGNRYNGSLYNYFRNEKLDANDWLSNSVGAARRPLRQNMYGGVLGGPVDIPKLYNGRNRTFFFFAYEGQRLTQPQPTLTNAVVPSLEARQLATGAIKTVFDAFPLPTAPALPGDPAFTARFVAGVSNPSQFDATALRLDHRLADNLNSFFRFSISPSSTRGYVFANGVNSQETNLWTYTGGLTWTVRPSVANDLRFNYSRTAGEFDFRGREIGGAVLPADDVFFPAGFDRAVTSVGWNLIAQGSFVTSVTQGRSLGNQQRQFNLVDNLTWITGRHQLKFGVDYRRLMPIAALRRNGITIAFGGPEAFLRTGLVNVSLQTLTPQGDFHLDNFSAYLQDVWKLTRRTTLTYGVRYELNPPPTGGRTPYTFNGREDPLTMTLAAQGTPLYDTQYLNLAPRIGIAHQLSEKRDLVLRAGFGIFFDTAQGTALRGYTSFPASASVNLTQVPFPVDPATLKPAAQNLTPPFGGSFYLFPNNFVLPFALQYNFALEKSLGRDQTLSLTYVGSTGHNLLRTERYRNQAAQPALGLPAVTMLNPALFNTSSAVFFTRADASSNYNSLQAQFQRRLASGLQLLASYTWSKSLDSVSDETSESLPASGFPGVNRGPANDYGPSSFDIRQQLTASVSYSLPALDRYVTKGWGLDAFWRSRTGLPVNIITTTVDLYNVGSNRRVDLVSGVPVYLSDPNVATGTRLNRDAFKVPAAATQGSLGRNAIRSAGFQQIDLAIRRDFQLREALRLQFRGELFNLANHPNFGAYNNSYSATDAQFGTIQTTYNRYLGQGGTSGGLNPLYQAGGPRSVQLSLRLSF